MKIIKKVKSYSRRIKIGEGKKIKYPRHNVTYTVPDVNVKKKITYGKGRICPKCGATKELIIKVGKRYLQRDKARQKYRCQWCNHKFSTGGVYRMRNNAGTITKAFNLLKQGYSTRDVQKKLNNIVSHVTISRWRRKWEKKKINRKPKNMK